MLTHRWYTLCKWLKGHWYIQEGNKNFFVTNKEGKANDCVGCMIKRLNSGILLHQSNLNQKIEVQFESEIKDLKEYGTPAAPGEGTVQHKDNDVCINEKEQFWNRSAVGMMLFLVQYFRPDISTAVRELSKSNNKANYAHYKRILRVVNYILKTRNRML